MIEFLNQNSGVISLLFAAVVAISTVVYAFLTAKLVNETRKMRKIQTEPNISVRIESNERGLRFVDIIVENIGAGPAYDVEFKLQKDLDLVAKSKFSEIGFIKNGIKYLAPKQKLRYFLTELSRVFNDQSVSSIEIEVIFKDYLGENYNYKYEINFEEFRNLLQIGTPPIVEITRSIKKINDNFNLLVNGSRKLKIDSYDKGDREEEYKRWEKLNDQSKNK